MSLLIALCLGLALSAGCGFRVFIPPLALSLASANGVVELSSDWHWLGTYPAIIVLSIATLVEVFAYFIPFVSNFLDSIEVFLAPIAGMILTASSLSMAGEFDPVLMWTVSLVAGGGTAEVVESTTALTRLVASGATAGIGGPVVSIVEAICSIIMSILAIFVPILAIALVAFLLIYGVRRLLKFMNRRKKRE